MKPSEQLVRFIAAKEGFKPVAYRPLPNDRWTVGYGSTYIGGKPVVPSQTISEDEAISALRLELLNIGDNIIKGGLPPSISQSQFDAVVSLVYNIGYSAFRNSDTGRAFYAGHDISDRFKLFNKSGGRVVAGLTNRREQEKNIYLNGTYSA